jgi:hypothetical protein
VNTVNSAFWLSSQQAITAMLDRSAILCSNFHIELKRNNRKENKTATIKIKTRGELIMPVESHVESLKVRHQQLEEQLNEMQGDLSVDDAELAEVKRRKLAIKDKIKSLQS